jgi:hypothetical protein
VEVTSQPTAAPSQTSSPMPTNVAPASVSQPGMSQSPTSQAYQVPVPQMPQVPAYQAAPAQQASAPQGNPWQEAFQALSASLNTGSPSQAQVPSSAYLTPNASGFSTSQLGFNSPSNVGAFGAADLQSPSFNPELYRAGSNARAASGSGKRRVSKSDQRRKS